MCDAMGISFVFPNIHPQQNEMKDVLTFRIILERTALCCGPRIGAMLHDKKHPERSRAVPVL